MCFCMHDFIKIVRLLLSPLLELMTACQYLYRRSSHCACATMTVSYMVINLTFEIPKYAQCLPGNEACKQVNSDLVSG